MSFLHQAWLLDRYGPRLNLEQLAEVLDMAKGSLSNRIYRGEIDLPTYLDGGRRFADVRDVAEYLDRMRQSAETRA
jgi:hypothetical protein